MEQYLEDIIDVNDFDNACLNIIESPCGSGKTTFAIKVLHKFSDEQKNMYPILYLVGTVNEKDALKEKFDDGNEYFFYNKPVILTYALFAKKCMEDEDFYTEYCVIVCDELSSCVNFSKINPSDDNLHIKALEYLYKRFSIEENHIIALDATPQVIIDYFDFDEDCINIVDLYGTPKSYKQTKIIQYQNINTVLNNLDSTKRGLIYTPRIKKMQEIITLLNRKGIKCNGFWSIRNEAEPMTAEQIKLRQHILKKGWLPADIQVLVINKSTERGINIYSTVDYVIVDDISSDVQTQARGRIRNDIDTLYIKSSDAEDTISVPLEYLDKKLYKDDKDTLCEILNIRNNGRLCKWNTIKKILETNGYEIIEKRNNHERYAIVKK